MLPPLHKVIDERLPGDPRQLIGVEHDGVSVQSTSTRTTARTVTLV